MIIKFIDLIKLADDCKFNDNLELYKEKILNNDKYDFCNEVIEKHFNKKND